MEDEDPAWKAGCSNPAAGWFVLSQMRSTEQTWVDFLQTLRCISSADRRCALFVVSNSQQVDGNFL
jgi:hypothetical protein